MRKTKLSHNFFLNWICLLFISTFIIQNSYGADRAAIIHTTDPEGWLICTKSSAYQLVISNTKRIYPVFYGSLAQASHLQKTMLWTQNIEELPVRSGNANKTDILEATLQNHIRSIDLEYISGEIITIDNRPTLKIIEKDRLFPIQVTSYIRVLSEFNILEKWIEVKNTSKKGNIEIKNLLSGSIQLPVDSYQLTQLSGNELSEFHPYSSDITPGLKIIENRLFKSNHNMPWFLIRPKSSCNNNQGPAWWGNVHYSGNWKIIFDNAESIQKGYALQVAGGINFDNTQWDLHPGETISTPKISFGYTNEGTEGASRDNAAYVRNAILPEKFRHELRPVLFNGWMNTTYHVNDSIELILAKEAASMGVELFAIDDGWFKGRTKGDSGLGDWVVDKQKFPNGLQPLIDSVHLMGMKFGLWVEPESMVRYSDVFKNHPDWALQYDMRPNIANRMFINLAKEDVFKYLFNSLDKLLSENKIDFIKWDQNTYLSGAEESGADPELQSEIKIRFITNLYRLVDTLRLRHPNVLFESCASGGGRVDLGMLSRMDQVWTSDNSMSVDRVFIQYSYLGARPANTMESWILGNWNNQQNDLPSLSYKFDVAMSGLLGIGDNILKWTPAQKQIAKNKISIYKEIRPVVQQGVLYRLVSPFDNNRSALQYNALDSNTAVLFCYNLAMYVAASYVGNSSLTGGAQSLNQGSSVLKLQGLISNQNYQIQIAGEENKNKNKAEVYTGDYLMNVGIQWPTRIPFDSRILIIKKVNTH